MIALPSSRRGWVHAEEVIGLTDAARAFEAGELNMRVPSVTEYTAHLSSGYSN